MQNFIEGFKRHSLGYTLLFILLILPIITQNRVLLSVMVMCVLYSYLALSWNLIGGYGGQFSLAHGAFFGLGAYTTGILFTKFGITPWVGLLIGGFIAAILGYIIGNLTFSFGLKGFFFLLVTLAITQFFMEVSKNIDFIGGPRGLWLPAKIGWYYFQFRGRIEYYYIIFAFMLIAIIITYLIEKSKLGYYLVAIREDEDAAEACGVDSKKCKTLTFALSGFLTGIGGGYYIQLFFFIDPFSAFSIHLNIYIVLMVIVGGTGTIGGPIIGAFFFVILSELLRFIPMQSQLLAAITKSIFAIALILVAIYFNKGIISLRYIAKYLK